MMSLNIFDQGDGRDHSNLEALKKLKQYYLLRGDLVAPSKFKRSWLLRPKNLNFREDLETLYAWSNQSLQTFNYYEESCRAAFCRKT